MKVAPLSKQEVAQLKEQYPRGTRIELDNMEDTWAVPAGTKGTVNYVDDAGHIHMSWDNGRSLALISGVDSFHRITEQSQSMGGFVPAQEKKPDCPLIGQDGNIFNLMA